MECFEKMVNKVFPHIFSGGGVRCSIRRLRPDVQSLTFYIQYSKTPLYKHLIIKDSLLCPWGKKALTFSLNSTPLIRTPRLCGHRRDYRKCPYKWDVSIKRVEFRENVTAFFPRDSKQTIRNNNNNNNNKTFIMRKFHKMFNSQ